MCVSVIVINTIFRSAVWETFNFYIFAWLIHYVIILSLFLLTQQAHLLKFSYLVF